MFSDKNLIIFSYDFPPSNGGIARLCQEIAVGMKSYYNTVTVLTRKKDGENFPYNLKDVYIIELPKNRLFCEIKAVKYLSKLKNKNNYDILCGTWHPEGLLAIMAGFKNVFVLGHGTEFLSGSSNFRKRIWIKYYANFVLRKSRLIIANSEYTKGLITKVSKDSNVVTLPLAVNHEFFKPDKNKLSNSEKLKICTVSRIEQFKGHDFIANVLLKINQKYPDKIEWNIGGTGEYLKELINLVNDLGIQKIVKFHGFVKDADLPCFYNQNDLFILCTRENPSSVNVEGFGLVFLEAQSCGIPVIGTKTGGISDAVKEGSGGWLIEQDNEKELYALFDNLLNGEQSIISSEGLKARLRVEKDCTWEIYCNNLFQLMRK
ncbi:glycosyltransferase family 4 protein [Flavobacterium sp. KBS0721]|uniref:glycosyltransferase family 4 protein n=1 Tax=Flavobacterium sp. KBS0721 TaxID=1179672 RepID=UPI00098FD327|nr:glycosyltransferase family 4 protein [Flavobacterium sp. KBS0721]QDW18872.1 glycosyltransferase family 4 protein [Flavobacterium sp. KBS0721]